MNGIMTGAMEENAKLIESLLEKAFEYGKTSFELTKLKALDKTSDIVSTVIPHTLVFVLIMSFMLFFNLGLAFFLGKILGSPCPTEPLTGQWPGREGRRRILSRPLRR